MIEIITLFASSIIIYLLGDVRKELPIFVDVQYCLVGTMFLYMILSWVF